MSDKVPELKRKRENRPGYNGTVERGPVALHEARAERSGARLPYQLSLLSLPLLLAMLLWEDQAAPALLVWLVLIFLISVAPAFTFSRWHVAQWTLLTSVALLLGVIGWGSAFLTLIAIGCWGLGSYISLQQVKRGDCWLWRWWDDAAELPRTWALTPDAAPAPAASAPSTTPAEALPRPVRTAPVSAVPADVHAAFAQGQWLVQRGRGDEAVACFLTAFREGPPELRRRAVQELEKLGEVETF